MNTDAIRRNAFLSGMFSVGGAWGVNWLITPAAHPDASSLWVAAVVAQIVVCGVLAIWFWRRAGSSAQPDPTTA